MAMTSGAAKNLHADPNVTPLIDVLLVLLIIFMVIVPIAPTGLATALPQPAKNGQPDPAAAVVVRVLPGPSGPIYQINGQAVQGRRNLAAELNRIFSLRANKVVFVQGDRQLDFASIAEVIDISHAAGVERVGILTPALAPK